MLFSGKKDLENYIPRKIPANNRKGYTIAYDYHGDWIIWDCDESKLRACKRCLMIGLTCSTLIFLFGGTRYARCNTYPLTAIPALLSAVALLIAGSGALSFSPKQKQVPAYLFRSMHLRLSGGLLLHGFLLAIAAGFCLYYIAANPVDSLMTELLAVSCYLVCCTLSFYLFYRVCRLPYHTKSGS